MLFRVTGHTLGGTNSKHVTRNSKLLKLKMKSLKTALLVLTFSIAFAFIESSVVVYIRELYYPEGFGFPLKLMSVHIIITEIFRELATLIILLCIGILAGRNFSEKIAYFILSFAIWDIFYYVFLKVLINWPESLMTWDILFFIPLTWVGPVLAPMINSLTMIVLASVIIYYSHRSIRIKFGYLVWSLLIVGSLITIYGYTEEFTRFMLQEYKFFELFGYVETIHVETRHALSLHESSLLEYAIKFIPQYFNWYIFGIGELLFFVAIFIFVKRSEGQKVKKK